MDTLRSSIDIARYVKCRLQLLFSLLEKEADSDIVPALRLLSVMINMLESSLSSSDISIEDVLKEVKHFYLSIFAQKGGLSDFVIWRDDFEERKILNNQLRDTEHDIYQILVKY